MPWRKGQSGNPGGLSKGSRRKLTEAFIRILARDWEAHGEEVIKPVSEENPAAFFKGRISLLPKDVTLEGHISEMTTFGSVPATMALLDEVINEGASVPDENEPYH